MITRYLLLIFATSLFFLLELNAQCVSGGIKSSITGTGQDLSLCVSDGVPDPVTIELDYVTSTDVVLVLTDRNFNILATSTSRTIDFEGAAPGESYVFAVNFDGVFLGTPGQNIYSVPLATGCFQMSTNRIRVNKIAVAAGLASTNQGATEIGTCIGNFDVFVGFAATGLATASSPWVWVITDANGLIVEITDQNYFNFRNRREPKLLVHGINYTGNLLLNRGDFLTGQVLSTGCYAITDNAIEVRRSEPKGGNLLVDGSEQFSLDAVNNQEFTIVRTQGSVTDSIYVLVDEALVIQDFFTAPTIDLACYDPGKYLIWAYAFTGSLQARVGEQLFNLAAQEFASECFDISSNAIVVNKNAPRNCPDPCLADAGALLVAADTVELALGSATLNATLDSSEVVPAGFESVFLLAQGQDQIIQGLRVDRAEFVVTEPGGYVLHHLVGELTDPTSPDYFDLSSLVFGQTTIGEFRRALSDTQRCVALTADFAQISVLQPSTTQCIAFAGGVFTNESEVEIVNGSAVISAMPDGNAVVPGGFEVVYLLTSGFSQTIQDFGPDPSFIVTEAGDYAIQVFIGETSNPADVNYINLDDLVLGQATTIDLIGLVFDNFLCGDLDFFGAQIRVTDPTTCTVMAGTTTAVQDTFFLPVGQSVTIQSTLDGNANVPPNFDRMYLLTEGNSQQIIRIADRPTFVVDEVGDYGIHAWVGEFTDPSSINYVDLNAITLSVTPLADLLAFINGAGLCSDIDAAGASIRVEPGPTARSRPAFTTLSDYGVLKILERRASTPQIGHYEIISLEGRLLQKHVQRLQPGENVFELDVTLLPAGMYYLMGKVNGAIATRRVLLR